ncbi:MAG TPA: helix-turn-helix transcriptional regulator [Clostridiaceae bacterium]|nr:helix-turn-helix transcriptional regulator [Clostridiaceae bacterium]
MKTRPVLRPKDRIFYSYLLSYLVICIISLGFSIFGYFNAENLVRQETLNSQTYMLSQLHNSFDSYISAVLRASKSLSGNDNLTYLAQRPYYINDDLLRLRTLKGELENVRKSIDFCSDVGIYFYRNYSILTADKRYSSEIIHLYTNAFGLSRDEFVEFIDIPDASGYRIMENDKKGITLFFIQNIYNYNYKIKIASIYITVPWKNITENIASIENGQVYWIDQYNTTLPGPGDSIPAISLRYNDFKEEQQLLDIKAENETYLASFTKSEYFDLKYIMLIQRNSYFKQINYMKLISITQMVLAFTIAIAMSIYYAQKNYHPISQIINIFRNYNKLSDEPINFDKIGKYLENLLSENRSLENSWKNAKIELSNQVLTGFIKGWSSDIDTLRETIASTESITLKETDYMVFLIAYRDVSSCNLFRDIKPEKEAASYELLQYVFIDVFNEKILSKYTGMLSYLAGTHLCIINLGDKDEDPLSEDIKECISWYKNSLNLNLIIGASSRYNSFEDLQKAYNEASQVLSYQLFWGSSSGSIMFYDEASSVTSTESNSTIRFLDNEKKIHNFLVAKEYDKAYDLLIQTMEESFTKDINYMIINQSRMYSLMNTVFSSICDIFENDNEEFIEKLSLMNRLLETQSIETAKEIIKEIFDDIVRYVNISLSNEQPKWLNDIVEYVNEHYNEPNLNISMIADHINMNLTYVGRTFKKYFGYSLTDYIHRQRLNHCKRLLTENKSVREVAEAVGYLDSKTLIRIFKKYEGITPGQFRNIKSK